MIFTSLKFRKYIFGGSLVIISSLLILLPQNTVNGQAPSIAELQAIVDSYREPIANMRREMQRLEEQLQDLQETLITNPTSVFNPLNWFDNNAVNTVLSGFGWYDDEILATQEAVNEIQERQAELLRGQTMARIELLRAQAAEAEAAGDTTRANELRQEAAELQVSADNQEQNIHTVDRVNSNYLTQVKAELSARRCMSFVHFDLDICVANIVDAAFGLLIWLYTWVLWVVSALFSLTIDFTIIKFSQLLTDMKIVKYGWTMARDVANIFFIFILLYTAFGTVLQITKVDAKKMVTSVIMMALFVNFSATFTKIAIDASNVGAITFYRMIGTDSTNPDLSAPFRNSLQQFSTKPAPTAMNSSNNPNAGVDSHTLGILAKNAGLVILITITIFTLGSACILFLVRGVSLIILLMTAPLAFLGYGFEPLKEVYKAWSDRLRCDLLFAPIFMFFLYIIFAIYNEMYSAGGLMQQAAMKSNVMSQVFIFMILNGLMLGGLMVAQKVGCQMAGDMYKRGKGLAKTMTKAFTTKPAGYAARSGIGRAAREFNKSPRMQRIVAKNPLVGGALKSGLDKVSSAKFGLADGYNEALDKKQKRQKEIFKSIKNPELKAQYLQNLGGKGDRLGTGERDRRQLYEEMTDREKADLEIKNLNNAPNREMIRELRNGLPEEKKESANKVFGEQLRRFVQYEGGEELSIKEQYNKFQKLADEEDRKTVYGNLSDIDKVNLEREAEEQARPAREKEERGEEPNKEEKAQIGISDEIKALREEYRSIGEKGQKIDKAESEMDKRLRNKESREIVAKLTEIAKNIKGGRESDEDRTYIAEKIKKISGGEVAALPTELLAHRSTAPHINVQVVKQIQKNSSNMSVEEYEAIIKNLGQNGTQEVQDYINYGVDTNTRGNQARRRGSETSLERAQRESRERAQNSRPAANPNNDTGRPDSN